MPPKKKSSKQSANGFWNFALKVKAKPQNQHLSNDELQELAGNLWKKMSLNDRQEYRNTGTSKNEKYTSDGVPLSVIKRKEQEEQLKMEEMKKEIDLNFQAANEAGNLANEVFLIIHINHLIYHPVGDKYYICEISVVPFSLQTGIFQHDVFHEYVKPGSLPIGFYCDAKLHSNETHQLIDYVMENREDNTREVFFKLMAYLKNYMDVGKLPILYSPDKIFKMTESVLNQFCEQFQCDEQIKVYNMQYMFYALKNTAADHIVWVSDTFSHDEIDRDVYAYSRNICCTFHDVADLTYYCSRSIGIRYAYIICSNCCSDFNIALIPGLHVPLKDKDYGADIWSSSASTTNRQSLTTRDTGDTASESSTLQSSNVLESEDMKYTPKVDLNSNFHLWGNRGNRRF